MGYPNLFRRYAASTIDVLAILFAFYLLSRSPLISQDQDAAVYWPLWLFVVYEPVANRFGSTLGQLLMRFRVRTLADRRKVPIWRGLIRVIAKYCFGIFSFLMMPVQKQRRAFHDILSGTIVLEASAANDIGSPN